MNNQDATPLFFQNMAGNFCPDLKFRFEEQPVKIEPRYPWSDPNWNWMVR